MRNKAKGNGNGNGKNGAGKKKYYCYTPEGNGRDWTLFKSKHEPAAAANLEEMALQLARIRAFHRTDTVLCVKKVGQPRKTLPDLGSDPTQEKLNAFGLILVKFHDIAAL